MEIRWRVCWMEIRWRLERLLDGNKMERLLVVVIARIAGKIK